MVIGWWCDFEHNGDSIVMIDGDILGMTDGDKVVMTDGDNEVMIDGDSEVMNDGDSVVMTDIITDNDYLSVILFEFTRRPELISLAAFHLTCNRLLSTFANSP